MDRPAASDVTGNTSMAKVLGVGGVFFKSPDPDRLYHWYSEHLGITKDDGPGVSFQNSEQAPAGFSVWSAFGDNTKYFDFADAIAVGPRCCRGLAMAGGLLVTGWARIRIGGTMDGAGRRNHARNEPHCERRQDRSLRVFTNR